MNYKIAVISGDGIGPEIVREARKVLDMAFLLTTQIFSWEALPST